MHVRELVELAALLSGHADVLVADGSHLTREGMSEYWTASKVRLEMWSRSLERLTAQEHGKPNAAGDGEEHGATETGRKVECPLFGFVPAVVEPLLHEIFASEVLTRVWAAVVSIFDQQANNRAASAVARSILLSHQEMRGRALQWMLEGPLAGGPHADAVNLLRRRCERWTDLLLANVSHLGRVGEFAFDPLRASDFARDVAEERKNGSYATAWALTMSSLRASLQVGIARESYSRLANRRISAAILACLGPDLFTSTGSLRSAWLARLQRVTSDTEFMLGELLTLEHVSRW